jgi:ABC-type uncharacterized transport system substrate-binding protein
MTEVHFREFADLAAMSRLPAIAAKRSFAEAGLLMSYGADLRAQGERRAAFVDKILKGAKPADIPVEQPTKFELVINLKTAKAIGLSTPAGGTRAGSRARTVGKGAHCATPRAQSVQASGTTRADSAMTRIRIGSYCPQSIKTGKPCRTGSPRVCNSL